MLGPEEYGVLSGLGTVVLVIQAPVSIVALVYTRRGAEPRSLTPLNLWWGALGVALWLVMWAGAGFLAETFHLPKPLVIIYGLAVIPGFAFGVNVGVLQWAARFVWVGGLSVLDSFGRTSGAAISYLGRWGIKGLVMLSPAVSVGAWIVSWRGAQRAVRLARREGLPAFGGLWNAGVVGMIVLLISSTDVLAAKHALSPHAAGLYSGLATMGRAPMFFAGAVGTVLLSSTQRDPARGTYYLARSMAILVLLSFVGLLVYSVLGPELVTLALGPRFLPLVPLLVQFTLAMSLQALALVGLYYGAARSWALPTGIGAASLVVWVAIIWNTHHLTTVISETTGAMLAMMVAVMLSLGLLHWVLRRKLATPPTGDQPGNGGGQYTWQEKTSGDAKDSTRSRVYRRHGQRGADGCRRSTAKSGFCRTTGTGC